MRKYALLQTAHGNVLIICRIVLPPKAKKTYSFPEMRVTTKIFTWAAANLFF